MRPRFTQEALDDLVAQIDNQGAKDPDDAWEYCNAFDAWIIKSSGDRSIPEAELDRFRCQVWYMIARLAYTAGDVNVAIDNYKQAIERCERIGNHKRQILCMKDLAVCCQFSGMQDESTRIIFEALDLAENLGDKRTIGLVLYGLASLYSAQGAHDQAKDTTLQTLDIAIEIEDAYLECYARGGIGLCLGYLDQPEEGIRWIEEGLELCRDGTFPRFEAYLNGYLVFLLRTAGRLDEALEAAERWLGTIEHLPAQNAAFTYVNVAEVHWELGDYDRAAELLGRADDVARGSKLTGHLVPYHQLAARIHESRGDYQAAFESMKKHAELQNELNGNEAQARLIATERHYASELLAKDDEIHRLKAVELVSKNEQLFTLNREKEEILQVVAHDLQNPLAAVSYISENLLATRYQDNEPLEATQLESIRRAAGEMQETVADLLDAESESKLHKVPVEVGSVVLGAIDRQRPHAERKEIALGHTIEKANVLADAGLLRRAVDNLISNSIKYSLVDTTITVEVQDLETQVQITVRDQGVGLTALEAHRVFDKFAQTGPQPTNGERSNGLGLYIAKRLIARMGGQLLLTSPGPNKGALAIIELPRHS